MNDLLGLKEERRKKLIKEILEKEEFSRRIRAHYLERWHLMMLAELGEFLIKSTPDGRFEIMQEILTIDEKNPQQAIEVRDFINLQLLRRIWLTHADAYLSVPPYFVTNPASSDIADITAAQAAQLIADTIISPKLETRRLDLIWWFLWIDTTFIKVCASEDKEILVPIIVDENYKGNKKILEFPTPVGPIIVRNEGKPMYQLCDEKGNPVYKKVTTKELQYRIVPPHEALPDPNARGMNCLIDPKDPYRARWFTHEIKISKNDLEMMDLDPKEFQAHKMDPLDELTHNALSTLGVVPHTSAEEMYRYSEFYELPTKEFPDGLKVTHIEDKIVSIEPLPELGEEKRLPFVDFRDNVRGNTLFSKTILGDARLINREICAIFSKIRKVLEEYGEQTVLARTPGELEVHHTKNLGSIKRIIEIENQATIAGIDTIPMFYIRYIDLLLQLMEHITMTYQIKYPTQGQRTAFEIAQIIKENETAQSVIMQIYKNRLILCAKLGLEIIKNYYADDQIFDITSGQYSVREIFLFRKANILKGNFDYSLSIGQLPFTTRIGRLAWIKELLSIPQIASMLDGRTILNLLNVRELAEDTIIQLHEKRANQENINYYTDPFYQAVCEDFDDDQLHINKHQQFLLIHYYSLLPQTITDIQRHIQEHQQQLFMKTQAMQQMMQLLSPQQQSQQTTKEETKLLTNET